MITNAQICDAVKTTLKVAANLIRSQSYDELTEGMQDTPALQVYWQSSNQDPSSRSTDRTTFRGDVRQTNILIRADVYAAERSHLAEDNEKVVTLVDEIIAILEAQKTKPYFGLAGIKAFSWTAERVVIDTGSVKYAGIRFDISVRVF